jgi:Family of unknown function (DUF5681)
VETENRQNEYEVGYGRPPRNTRFEKGQSGNYRGRPRGAKNMATHLKEALRERVVINENGRRKRVTKMDVVSRRLVNKAAEGDLRFIQILVALSDKYKLTDREEKQEAWQPENHRRNLDLIADAIDEMRKLGIPVGTRGLGSPGEAMDDQLGKSEGERKPNLN